MTYPGLVAYWTLDEAEGQVARDNRDRLPGVVHGSPLWLPEGGRINGAVQLDGIDDFISTGNILNPADGPFTVFIRVQGGRPGQTILSQSNTNGSGEVWLGTDASTGAVLTRLTDGSRVTQPLTSTAVVTDGVWHCVRLVWDGSSRHLYVDGKEVAADKRKLNALKFSRSEFHFAAGKDLEPASFWSGRIDDIRVHSGALIP